MSQQNKITVLIADAQPISREGLKRIIETSDELKIIGEANTAHAITREVLELSPDILVIDLKWYGDETAGAAAIREVKKISPKTKILVITGHPSLIQDARRAGADAALTKNFTIDTFLSILNELYNREEDFNPPAAATEPTLMDKLTKRESEVLRLLMNGCSDKEISQTLHIAENTAKNHVSSILSKLDAKNRTHAASIARKLNLV